MSSAKDPSPVEDQIDQWRGYLRRRRPVQSVDIATLEIQLREHLAALVSVGLTPEEAFLVAVKRVGIFDVWSREFAREHPDLLWRPLCVSPIDSRNPQGSGRMDAFVAFGLAVAAAVMIQMPALFGISLKQHPDFYLRHVCLMVLPLLAGYFAWKRRINTRTRVGLAVAFLLGVILANAYEFAPGVSSLVLTALHLPIALWLAVGVAYAGGRWRQVAGRMDFIRFSGELFIHYVLIALGGGVLMGFTAMIFKAIGIRVDGFFEAWVVPCGAMGAVLIASWLADTRQSVIENMAPVLTRLFTPLFTAVLLTFLATLLWTGRRISGDRDVIMAFDVLLALVLGLLLYSVSARDPGSPPGGSDVLQVVLLMSALVADAVALWAIAARITEFGFTPNRVAALGGNLMLLIHLGWSAVLYVRFLVGKGPFAALEKWQTDYLPVYGAWAALVVILFPPLFGYV